jgi:hypothetical protein
MSEEQHRAAKFQQFRMLDVLDAAMNLIHVMLSQLSPENIIDYLQQEEIAFRRRHNLPPPSNLPNYNK